MTKDILRHLFFAFFLIGGCLFIGFVFIDFPIFVLFLCLMLAISVYWILT